MCVNAGADTKDRGPPTGAHLPRIEELRLGAGQERQKRSPASLLRWMCSISPDSSKFRMGDHRESIRLLAGLFASITMIGASTRLLHSITSPWTAALWLNWNTAES